ncbi:MAG TPA: FHA domain-containing protein [Candidatus Acidoferrum sp.]|nr:FHA domain-containing protein [Candidatus Acidoferrum sp.]
MQTGCIHCGQQHLLKDDAVAKHPKVSFRCTKCGLTTIVEIKRSVDQTVVISPMPSFARADASTQRLRLLPMDDGLRLPDNLDVILTVESGPQANTSFTLSQPRTVIGRKGADIALEDPEISRHHCVIEVRERNVNLKDLDSTNGTFFEGERARAVLLKEGAMFRIGSSLIRVTFRPK